MVALDKPAMTGRVVGEFLVGDRIGKGGYGDVYLARQLSLDRDVVVKVLRGSGESHQIARFEHEARIASKLDHPYAAHVYAFGVEPDGVMWIAMELVRGTTLSAWIKAHGPMPLSRFAGLFERLCEVVYTAHGIGLVHRDIKPANVMVVERANRLLPKLLDFGIALSPSRAAEPDALDETTSPSGADDGDDTLTAPALAANVPLVAGTPAYMAPEQWHVGAIDHRVDVYALGVLAYRCLVGRGPFERSSPKEYLHAHASAPVPPLGGHLPRALDEVLGRALAKDPASRYASAIELAEAFATAAGVAKRTRVPLMVLGVTALTATAVIVTAMTSTDAPATCDVDSGIHAGIWDDATEAELRAVLGSQAEDAATRITTMLDARRRDVEAALVATCVAERDGFVSEAQAARRRACLERRVFELDATVRYVVDTHAPPSRALDRVRRIGHADSCADTLAPPLAPNRDAIRALYVRYVRSHDLAVPATAREHATELAAIEQAASQLDERELAARTAYSLAAEHAFLGDPDAAEAALQRTYVRGTEIRAPRISVMALVDRSELAVGRGKPDAGMTYATLARELVAQAPEHRGAVLAALGAASAALGDHRAAVEQLEEGLALAKQDRVPPWVELKLRFALVASASELDGRATASVALARETLRIVEKRQGKRHPNYGVALNVLADALRAGHDLAGAIPVRREALALLSETLPANHPSVLLERAECASDRLAAGEHDEAHREIEQVLADANGRTDVKPYLAELANLHAQTAFATGHHDDARRLAVAGLEDALAQHGKDHPITQRLRLTLLDQALERGEIEPAEHQLAVLERTHRNQRDRRRALAGLGYYAAEIALARGRPQEAERIARDRLRIAGELAGDTGTRATLHLALGDALLAEGKGTAALVELSRALALAHQIHANAGTVAVIEVKRARAELLLGRRGAVDHARAARAILAGYSGLLRARAEADAVLAARPLRR